MRRRMMTVFVGLTAAVLMVSAGPAWAAASTHSASAFWDVGDALHTRVSLQGSETPGKDRSMFLFVTQSFCDTGTNEMVFRNFLAQAPLAPKDFSVQPSLKSARLSATTTVNGTEQRQSNCSAPSGPVTTTSLGQSTVTVNAQWLATGPAHEVQPGITARNATATGSITGTVLNPGSLGTSQTAELREVAH